MLRLYLEKQDNTKIIICDEFFDIPLYGERDWEVLIETENRTEIESKQICMIHAYSLLSY